MKESKKFEDGQKLEAVFWGDTEKDVVRVGRDDCESIIIIMENGQMSPVAWAYAKFSKSETRKFNLAHAEGVILPKSEESK